jgi:hypothetical protein
MYLYEQAREAHSQDLRREAEKERMLSHLPGHHRKRSRYAAGKLGVLLLKLGARLKQYEQADAVMEAISMVSVGKEPFQDFGLHLSERRS